MSALLMWGPESRGLAMYGGCIAWLKTQPRLMIPGEQLPVDFCQLVYCPTLGFEALRLKRRPWRALMSEERTACHRLLDAMARAPQTVMSADQREIERLMRFVGADEGQ